MTPPEISADLSIYALFANAHFIVKLVMIGLILASIWSWAIIIEKFFVYARTKKETDEFENIFWSGQALDDLYQALSQRRNTSAAAIFVAAMREWIKSSEAAPSDRSKAVSRRSAPGRQGDGCRHQPRRRALGAPAYLLATVGSTAPFVGLFGTVWGIMRAFRRRRQREHLARRVAPGIAEALFATALGLFAAIPALIFYNKFNSDVARHPARLEGFSDEFAALLSRHIDVRA